MQNRGNNLCRQKKKSPPFYERTSVITRRNLCCGGKEPLFLLYIIATFSVSVLKKHFALRILFILSQSRRLPPLQVVSNSKFVSVGVQSPTEINAPRGCAVILIGICRLLWPESRAKSHGRSTWKMLNIFLLHWYPIHALKLPKITPPRISVG